MANRAYVVVGDSVADNAREAHSTKILCDKCVNSYKVLAEDGPIDGPCEKCGENFIDEDTA